MPGCLSRYVKAVTCRVLTGVNCSSDIPCKNNQRISKNFRDQAMNVVEFLSNHRVVVNRQARGAPLPHLTDSAVKTALAELNRGASHNSIQWRGRGGGMPTHSGVEFERQLDKISIWLEGWNHTQKCQFLQELLLHSSYTQLQLLHTVLQPALHRDFMYTVRSRFPEIDFSPVSTFTTRELRDKLVRLRLDTFHRVGSAHYQKDVDVQPLKLPLLLQQESSRSTQSIPNIFASQNSLDRLSTRRETQSQREAKVKDKDRWIGEKLEEKDDKSISQDAVSRFVEMPVRRHMQEEQMSREARRAAQRETLRKKHNKSIASLTSLSNPGGHKKRRKLKWITEEGESRDATTGRSDFSKFSTMYTGESVSVLDEPETSRLPVEASQIMSWYIEQWNDTKKNEFLHKLLLKLDPRQHYFISSYLSVKHHKDIVGLLPDHLALKILQYLSPKELLVAGQVSKRWSRLANDNALWRAKCEGVTLEIPVPSAPVWKRVFKDNLYLRLNWNKGFYSTVDFRGHTHR
ncbi:histone-lysine N-methyltransferase SETMAR [Plakobranchus ocellatus]|uniref:Histone-lysine N-methyltransferase SETMAR n=1 Tax=Plakobranchus ocellatus TaxID=259542 RepID=A0AAV4CN56_9GAST|nr:histone-lysine N-methyltransferase SETMAR [Plakobranchus ocellatus]